MKPQQQNTDLIGHSHVYVQKPDGTEINVPIEENKEPEGALKEQTTETIPTTQSKEVSSGEDA